jgi:hypothetical protein
MTRMELFVSFCRKQEGVLTTLYTNLFVLEHHIEIYCNLSLFYRIFLEVHYVVSPHKITHFLISLILPLL